MYIQAVCCSDGLHCCPNGYTCTDEGCARQDITTVFSNLLTSTPVNDAPVLHDINTVKCGDGTECPDGSTCCKMTTGQYGCCPMPQVNTIYHSFSQ